MPRTVTTTTLNHLAPYDVIVALVAPTADGSLQVLNATPSTIEGLEIPDTLTQEWCERQQLTNKVASSIVLRSVANKQLALVVTNGTATTNDEWRRVGATVHRLAGPSSVAVVLPVASTGATFATLQALSEGLILASYQYKKPDESSAAAIAVVGTLPEPDRGDVPQGTERGSVVANTINWAKRLIDTPAMEMTPKEFAKRVEAQLEGLPDVSLKIWADAKIEEERLGGLIGVNLGSGQPARLTWASYRPETPNAVPHVFLVGKGITFDSGGLSIKPATGMMTMKTDMTGAAVVNAVVAMAAALALPIRVSAVALLTENMTGHKAMRPGDVITIRNGKTVEVLNTDAEGRLVLADGLSLAVESEPDVIIDVATLTGAQVVGLGDEISALFASTDTLAADLLAAAEAAGEPTTRLPLFDGYESHIDSDVADVKNIGKVGVAGSISAALFLRRFTDGRPWAHFDIAGPGRSDAVRGYYTKGATAYSARTLLEYLIAASR